jgi:glycolate oxidase
VEGRGDQDEQQLIATGKLIKLFQKIVGRDGVLSSPSVVHAYECDAYTVARARPSCVVLPTSTEQVRGIVRLCNLYRVPYVARGAGTGLSGGATPVEGAVVISLKKMNRIKQIDLENRMVLAEAGVVNLHITKAVQSSGYCFAPDPSS